MTSGDSLRETAQLVEVLRDVGISVEDVTVTADAEGELVELAVRLPEEAAELADETVAGETGVPVAGNDDDRAGARDHADEDGGPGGERQNVNSSPDAAGPGAADGEDTPGATDGGSSEAVVDCRVDGCDRTFSSSHGMKIHAAKAHDVQEAGDEQPHRDPERLREVYDEHDTFDEMREALGADVTAQTVRRNMMKFGIHEPEEPTLAGHLSVGLGEESGGETDDGFAEDADDGATTSGESTGPAESDDATTASPDESEEQPTENEPPTAGREDETPDEVSGASRPQVDADETSETVGDVGAPPADSRSPTAASLRGSLDLPADVEVEAFVEAVKEARTLFEFQRALGLDRPTAQELLATLDLYDLVTGRVGTSPVAETPEEEIVRRIEESLDTSAGGSDGLSAD